MEQLKKLGYIFTQVLKWILFSVFILSLSVLASPFFPILLLSRKACSYMEKIIEWYVSLNLCPDGDSINRRM